MTDIRYTVDELEAIRQAGGGGTDWERVLNMSQEEADANAVADDGAYLQDPDFWPDAISLEVRP